MPKEITLFSIGCHLCLIYLGEPPKILTDKERNHSHVKRLQLKYSNSMPNKQEEILHLNSSDLILFTK